jgi:thiol-disulfide isomerase/thioredoxin
MRSNYEVSLQTVSTLAWQKKPKMRTQIERVFSVYANSLTSHPIRITLRSNMKRFLPYSFAIVVLFFASSLAQQPKPDPQPVKDLAAHASKPKPLPLPAASDYPFLPEALMTAEFENLDGTTSILPRYKGKVVLVNLWGIWCGPCRDEMPRLQAIFDAYHSKGLEILGLNIGDHDGEIVPFESIQMFASSMKITYPLGRADQVFINQIYRLSKQQVVPQTILIDRDGHLRAIFVGGGQRVHDVLQENIEKTMAE